MQRSSQKSDGGEDASDSDSGGECGNHKVEDGEQCDDGNFNPGDGCYNCMYEDGGSD